jgi:UTP--glucose-1-phosphate uridylyltransferase
VLFENSLIEVLGLIEKPEPSKAPSNLAIIGRYILQPSIFDDLGRFEFGAGGEIQLTDSIAQQVGLETINGFKFNGRRFDCGNKVGFLEANIAYALNREDLRDPIQQFIKTLS